LDVSLAALRGHSPKKEYYIPFALGKVTLLTFSIMSPATRPATSAAPPGLTLSTNTGLSPETWKVEESWC